MAYNEFLADRVREAVAHQSTLEEKKMMGGVCFLVDGKMLAGIVKDDLMVRLDPARQEEALQKPGCREMDFTKRPMSGFVFVDSTGLASDEDLAYWIDLALEFNPKAKRTKKK